jgi:hypothetical protein
MTQIDLSKLDAPWRKVSERPMPKDGQMFVAVWLDPARDHQASTLLWDEDIGEFLDQQAHAMIEWADPPDLWIPLPEEHR